jgi:hypothetical protein
LRNRAWLLGALCGAPALPTHRCPAEDDEDDEGDGVEELSDEGVVASAEAC